MILPPINFKKILAFGVIALLIYSIGITYLADRWHGLSKLHARERDEAVRSATDSHEQTQHYLNKYNQEVARVRDEEISKDNFKRLLNSKEFEHIKHVNGLKNNIRNLESTISLFSSIRHDTISLRPIIIQCDSFKLRGLKWSIHDKYNDIEGVMLDTPRISVPINIVRLWERRHKIFFIKFGKKIYEDHAFSPNTYLKIDSLRVFVKRK